MERWRGREEELESDEAAKAEYEAGAAVGDIAVIPVWASEAIDLITASVPRPNSSRSSLKTPKRSCLA